MDDFFSNKPHDEFEDINSNSKSSNEFEDIFSNSDKSINDIFSKAVPEKKPEEERTYYSKNNSYDEDIENFVSGRAPSRDKNNDQQQFEDVSSGKKEGKQKKKGKKKKVIAAVAIVLVLCILAGVGFAYKTYKDIIGELNTVEQGSNQYVRENDLTSGDGITNILLIGSDTRVSDALDSSRSDTTILMSIDTKSKQIKLISFLRDSYVEIPDRGHNKLNAAFSKGGAQLLMDTLEYNFGIDIDNFIAIDFESFEEIINALGGVDVEVTSKEAKYINSQDHMTQKEIAAFSSEIEGGPNHFTGAQALWYCRIRYLDSDFNRTQRQRQTLNAALQQAKTKSFKELVSVAKLGASKVTTDLTEAKINAYSQQALSLMKYEIVDMQVPVDGTWSNVTNSAGACLKLDMDANKQAINTFIYGGKVEKPTEETTK